MIEKLLVVEDGIAESNVVLYENYFQGPELISRKLALIEREVRNSVLRVRS